MHASFLQFGHLRLSLYGICAALGLMGALSLSQVTARRAHLDASAVWDAGLTMITAAFLISRALLMAGNWRSFLAAPLLVLSLPSLNDTGILLTAIFMALYLQRKQLPLLAFLDAMAPCFALVWAFLSLGQILAGTHDGMPTRSLLGVRAGTSAKLQPIEFYTLAVALALGGMLLYSLPKRRSPGLGCALGVVLAGAALFLLDFLRVPSALDTAAILDPVQWLGLAMMVSGAALSIALPAPIPSRDEKEASHAI